MVVGWGRCGRTVTQTQNFASWRAVVVESGPAWLARGPVLPPSLKPGCAAFFTASWVCSGIVKGTASAESQGSEGTNFFPCAVKTVEIQLPH